MTPPAAPAQNRHGSEAGFQSTWRCLGPCCGAVGKAMLEGYCNKCYVKEQSARLNQAAHRTPHSPPPVTVGLASHLVFTGVLEKISISIYLSIHPSIHPSIHSRPLIRGRVAVAAG